MRCFILATRLSRSYRIPAIAQHQLRHVHSGSMAGIKVLNSLKPGPPMPFVPIEEGKVSWYICGPTVYDDSHLGHARNYVSSDIIRRILMHYFKYKVNYVMNITDIDDKIIIRARRKRLLELEKKKDYSADDKIQLGKKAFEIYARSNLPLLGSDGDVVLDETNYAARRDEHYGAVLAGGTLSGDGRPGDAEAKVKMHIANMDAAAKALSERHVFGGADEILLPYLDSLYKETVDTSDQSMFTDLTKKNEDDFFRDMDSLNVLRPDIITRVTEYVPQIAKFVEQIVEKGFAYEAEGSVYFDIAAFEKSGNTYARLRPESRNDKALQEEGEGSLSKDLGGKRGPGDFALWKRSKSGEPYWESKWGKGRPGWHIECSVMASDKLGSHLDVHSGGIDLAFPHHDNELAQSEAYYCQPGHGEHTWVNYFWHIGHLHISGSKMSKSLKNFQTIKDALATTYTARNMRIVFLMARWNDGVETGPDMRKQADNWESLVDNFFTNTKSKLTEAQSSKNGVEALSLSETGSTSGLHGEFELAQRDLDAALSDSFDTPTAMQIVLRLIKNANIHMNDNLTTDLALIEAIARWVTKIAGILGLDANAKPPYEGLGWAPARSTVQADPHVAVKPFREAFEKVRDEVRLLRLSESSLDELLDQNPTKEFENSLGSGVQDLEALALPYVRAVSRVRDELRRLAPSLPADSKKAVLALSDRIRDYDLTALGVQLDDQADKPSLIKFVPAEKLIAARKEKEGLVAEKARQKEEARLAREKAEQEKWAKAKVQPQDMFRGETEKYSAWDEDGLPSKMKDGSEVPKSQQKKLKKDWDRQKKLHEEWQGKFGAA